SLAFPRLRELAEAESPGNPECVPMLLEASAFEQSRSNIAAAQAHLAAALKIAPRDPLVSREYRRLGAILAGQEKPKAIDDDIDSLTEKYRADPSNERVADALADALERASRAHELVALLLGRAQDFPQHASAVKTRFERLARDAESETD